jgi:hypothetical protein
MRYRREREPEQALEDGSPLEACNRAIASVRAKANNNEQASRIGTAAIAIATALIPLSLVLSTEWLPFLLGKATPALMAAVASVVAIWLQFERPHERWQMYRGYQRLFESERLRYLNEVDEYSTEDRDSQLIRRIADISLKLHQDWSVLVPTSADVARRGTV